MPKVTSTKKIIDNPHNVVLIGIKKIISGNQVAINVRGTGFIVCDGDDKFIVSCAHVYQQIPEAENDSLFCGIMAPETKESDNVKRYNFVDIKFVKKHPDDRRDVCIFKFSDNVDDIKDYGYDKKKLATEDEINKIKPIDTIEFNGFPLANELMQRGRGITIAASRSVVSAIKFSSLDKRVDFILIDKLVNPGSSGSPVFLNDKIIGIASGTLNQTTKIGETFINIPVNIGMVRASNYILELLDDKKSQ
jgi:V8-like Glu-specific endopeptidase